ncbi:MAG: lytic transglycosylase domain-containing protein [Actinobacteria bacterium]|nr:lytic transglycosylase domain-containing protein [Actinomycetota bacterium]
MRLSKIAIIVVILPFFVIMWYQWSFTDRFDQVFYPLEYKEEIGQASEKYSIDPYLIAAMIYEESKFNPSSESRAGAVGLMQIMPDTGRWVAGKQKRNFHVGDLLDYRVNIDMGCWYFDYLRDRYDDERLALAAYNSGHKNVDHWLNKGLHNNVDDLIKTIPFKETREYVEKVMNTRQRYADIYAGEFR